MTVLSLLGLVGLVVKELMLPGEVRCGPSVLLGERGRPLLDLCVVIKGSKMLVLGAEGLG